MGFGGAYGLDFGAVLAFASARRGPLDLVADLLPSLENTLLLAHATADEEPT